MTITEKIIAIRTEKRIKSSEIAYELEMTQSNYARLEKRDKELSISQLEKIAYALGVTIDEILHYGEDRTKYIIWREEEKANLGESVANVNRMFETLGDLYSEFSRDFRVFAKVILTIADKYNIDSKEIDIIFNDAYKNHIASKSDLLQKIRERNQHDAEHFLNELEWRTRIAFKDYLTIQKNKLISYNFGMEYANTVFPKIKFSTKKYEDKESE
jgi:DNA-binding Xre family transcriptional regulator